MNNNPILIASGSVTGVIVFVKALISLTRAMQWFSLTDVQWDAWSGFFETTIPIAAVWVGAWWVAKNTTNLAAPTDVDGARLSRPDNKPALREMESIQTQAIQMDKTVEQTRGLK